jgi:hypothetical protein
MIQPWLILESSSTFGGVVLNDANKRMYAGTRQISRQLTAHDYQWAADGGQRGGDPEKAARTSIQDGAFRPLPQR